MRTPSAVALVVMITVACATVAAQAPSSAGTSQARGHAERLFERYVALGKAFDPALADLYSDDAVIQNKRTYPTGQVREMTLPAPQYKALIRQAMPLAKMRADTNVYSACTYTAEQERVRIACTRYSELKKYSSPISLLVGPGVGSEWQILEELSESQP